jgi:hypothetical protein
VQSGKDDDQKRGHGAYRCRALCDRGRQAARGKLEMKVIPPMPPKD